MERFETVRTEIQRNIKKPGVILIIVAIVTLLFIFVKVHVDRAGEAASVLELGEQNHTEATEGSPTPESVVAAGSTIESAISLTAEDAGTDGTDIGSAAGLTAEGAGTDGTANEPAADPATEDAGFGWSAIEPATFDLAHAINVGESIHLSENGDLEWQGKIVHLKGGTLGAYEEVVNIFNGTDYHIYEVYDVLVYAHPELKTDHLEPYECEDVNSYYGFTVSRAPAEINEIDNALREGRLVQLQVHSNQWRNAEGEQVDWPGYHSGLIFYFDGTFYHMKAPGKINQKNAVYTREQLIDWIGGTSKQLVIYTKYPY